MKNKYYLITGIYGFVAQNLTKYLLSKNCKVIGIYSFANQKNIFDFNKDIKSKNLIIKKGNIKNKIFINKIFKNFNINFCIHLAAISQVLNSNKNPFETFNTNIMGTINILEAIRRFSPSTKLIFSSSDKAYGETKKLPYLENYPLNGLHPYDASKSSADIIVRSYANSFNINVLVTRFVNIYGPGDTNWNRLIPGVIRAIILGKKPIIRSDGQFLRDYIYIDDLITAYTKIFKYMNNSNIKNNSFNFGNNNPIYVNKVLKIILLNFNKDLDYCIIKNTVQNEIKDQYSDSRLAKKILNWKPKVDIDEGIKKTINWYRNYLK